MQTRAPVLDAAALDKWTDEELVSIVNGGIPMTGMPGFAEVYSADQVMDLVRYLRSQEEERKER